MEGAFLGKRGSADGLTLHCPTCGILSGAEEKGAGLVANSGSGNGSISSSSGATRGCSTSSSSCGVTTS